jgi:hypothetical protein
LTIKVVITHQPKIKLRYSYNIDRQALIRAIRAAITEQLLACSLLVSSILNIRYIK